MRFECLDGVIEWNGGQQKFELVEESRVPEKGVLPKLNLKWGRGVTNENQTYLSKFLTQLTAHDEDKILGIEKMLGSIFVQNRKPQAYLVKREYSFGPRAIDIWLEFVLGMLSDVAYCVDNSAQLFQYAKKCSDKLPLVVFITETSDITCELIDTLAYPTSTRKSVLPIFVGDHTVHSDARELIEIIELPYADVHDFLGSSDTRELKRSISEKLSLCKSVYMRSILNRVHKYDQAFTPTFGYRNSKITTEDMVSQLYRNLEILQARVDHIHKLIRSKSENGLQAAD